MALTATVATVFEPIPELWVSPSPLLFPIIAGGLVGLAFGVWFYVVIDAQINRLSDRLYARIDARKALRVVAQAPRARRIGVVPMLERPSA